MTPRLRAPANRGNDKAARTDRRAATGTNSGQRVGQGSARRSRASTSDALFESVERRPLAQRELFLVQLSRPRIGGVGGRAIAPRASSASTTPADASRSVTQSWQRLPTVVAVAALLALRGSDGAVVTTPIHT